MSKSIASLLSDFAKRPRWLQHAAAEVLEKGDVSATTTAELVRLCKIEAGVPFEEGEKAVYTQIPADAFTAVDSSQTLRLEKIYDVFGINALAPKKPLVFEDTPLVIVFGLNGSGKSGYVRALRHMCGTKEVSKLLGNVFEAVSVPQSCSVSYSLNGTTKAATWTPATGPIGDLKTVAIYDTAGAQLYINAENEVSYEPFVLRLFRILVDVCGKIEALIQDEIAKKISTLPILPGVHSGTPVGQWYLKLPPATTVEQIETRCTWTDTNEEELTKLQARVAEKSPAEKALVLRRTKLRLSQFWDGIMAVRARITDAAFDALQSQRTAVKEKRKAANEDVEKVFKGALSGIGTETWHALWIAARKYSEGAAYEGHPFPHVIEGSRCVLCQQPLDGDSKARLENFEKFVKGELETTAATAESALAKTTKDLELGVSLHALPEALDTAGIDDAGLRSEIQKFYEIISSRRAQFLSAIEKSALPTLIPDTLSDKIKARTESLESEAAAFDADAKTDNKKELVRLVSEAEATKWVSAQKVAIKAEMVRRQAISILEGAIRSANTKWLSDTKADLSESIISDAFAKRFKGHLKDLRGAKIKVKIAKTRTSKGKVYHQLLIEGGKPGATPADILSEGQFRIVSIAAFLADVESGSEKTPFVFDDPICSLDHTYERATAEKLVEISQKRQVIVFTHRLSMVSMLTEAAETCGIEPSSVSVRSESWGAGEPDPTLLAKQKPDKAIKTLIQERLKKAKAIFDTEGRGAYDPFGYGICTEVRQIVEKAVEIVLLNDVIQRFRKDIHTKGKLKQLGKIRQSDCDLLEELMTKYSFFIHDQPLETPVEVIEPDEIKQDLEKLLAWCEEFKIHVAA